MSRTYQITATVSSILLPKLLLCWGMGVGDIAPQAQSNKSLFASFSSEKEVS
jgi:hypothetical protein